MLNHIYDIHSDCESKIENICSIVKSNKYWELFLEIKDIDDDIQLITKSLKYK